MSEILKNPDFLIAVLTSFIGVSEALAFIPTVKNNSIFGIVVDVIKKVIDILVKLKTPVAPAEK